jgi:hypothetical protein
LLGAFFVAAAASAMVGLPLGPVHYTGRLGMKLGVVPLAFCLLFFVIVVGARDLAARLWRRGGQIQLSIATGFLAVVTDLNMEPLAWKIRAWWLWYPANLEAPKLPPISNYLTWFLLAAGCTFFMRSSRVAPHSRTPNTAPWLMLCVLNGVFLLTHAAGLLRR